MDSNLDLIQILVITEDIKITDVRNNLRNKNSIVGILMYLNRQLLHTFS